MIPKGLFTQLAMVILSIGIIVTYVHPEFIKVDKVQDDIEVYKIERAKIVDVNSKLYELKTRLDSVSNDDMRKLITYMPDAIDDIAVTRDLLIITETAGLIYNDASYTGPEDSQVQSSENESVIPNAYLFNLNVSGTYSQIKNLFKLMEQNDYPLDIRSVDIMEDDSQLLTANIEIITYTYQPELNNNEQIVF